MTTATPAALLVSKARVAFPDGPDVRVVLDDLDLEVAPGEIVVISGASGAGKSSPTLSAWSASMAAPPPEQVKPATRLPFGAPAMQTNFSVSSSSAGVLTVATP